MEKFQVETIPDIFREFTKKLEKESEIESYFSKAMNSLKQKIDFKSIFQEVQTIFRTTFEEYNNYLSSLLEKVRFYKTELGIYKDASKIKLMTNDDLTAVYKQLKKVFKAYQEERIRRDVMKGLNAEMEVSISNDENSIFKFSVQEKQKLKRVMENVE